jgi:hypothetical protein
MFTIIQTKLSKKGTEQEKGSKKWIYFCLFEAGSSLESSGDSEEEKMRLLDWASLFSLIFSVEITNR